MLETIREYATERLEGDPAFHAAAHRGHAAYYAEFTQRQWEHLTGGGRELALEQLSADLENIHTARHYWVEEKDLEQLSKFVDSLWLLYDARGWYHSTIELMTDMLNVLSSTPLTAGRIQQEILLQTSLARALQVIKGYTLEVEQAYTRALELSREVGDIPELFPVLRGLCSLYGYLGEYDKAGQLAEKILNMAERLDDPNMQAEGHLRLGYCLAFTGEVHQGLEHLETAVAGYDPDRYGTPPYQLGNNSGVIGLNITALLLWMVGFPERAIGRALSAVALARRLDHPYSLAYALFHTGMLHLWRHEAELAKERSEAVIEIAREHEFQVWEAVATCLHGAAVARLGQAEEGLAQVRRGFNLYQGLKTPPVFGPMLISIQAEVCGLAGRPEQGLVLFDQMPEISSLGDEDKNIFLAEAYGIKGDLLLILSPHNAPQAEALFQRGLEMARKQGLPMPELRAAIRLNRLWRDQGKAEQGKRVLNAAYEKFTEGFTTADLMEAMDLLS
jgi:tetratricopeptide (TPR) repeat protein